MVELFAVRGGGSGKKKEPYVSWEIPMVLRKSPISGVSEFLVSLMKATCPPEHTTQNTHNTHTQFTHLRTRACAHTYTPILGVGVYAMSEGADIT